MFKWCQLTIDGFPHGFFRDATLVKQLTFALKGHSSTRSGTCWRCTRPPANKQERDQVEPLSKDVQDATGENVTTLYADEGYTGHALAVAARSQGIELVLVGMKEARRGFVLLPRRWVV